MHLLGLFSTVFIPELSSGRWLKYFQRFGKMNFDIKMQIITGFDHICFIQNTENTVLNNPRR